MLRRFDQPRSPLLSGLGFIEEVLPFTDAVPTFCIGWCLQHLWPTTPVAQKMRIGVDTVPPAAALKHMKTDHESEPDAFREQCSVCSHINSVTTIPAAVRSVAGGGAGACATVSHAGSGR